LWQRKREKRRVSNKRSGYRLHAVGENWLRDKGERVKKSKAGKEESCLHFCFLLFDFSPSAFSL
jgi:hypothetical protein